jgi:two-component system OmpR family sensor kinase
MLNRIERAFTEQRAGEERLRQFVADASHELRTPLTSLRGYAELFRRGAAQRPEDLAKVMRRIEEDASRMGLLVDDLLLLARLDQGRPLDQARVELGEVASEAVESAHAVEPDRPLRLDRDPEVVVVGDRHRLRQLVDNLLANVRVHTPARAPAVVRVLARGGRAVLEVEDTGPGLRPETADRVFERFYRGDPGRSRDRGGSGLGLAIVDAIAHAHQGQAEATSRPGAGATFRVTLPLTG